MPLFRADFERHVSRTVSLRQTRTVYIEAVDAMQAQSAAWQLDDDDLDGTWEDDDASRVATNDEIDVRPRPERVYEVAGCNPHAIKATEVLGFDDEDEAADEEDS